MFSSKVSVPHDGSLQITPFPHKNPLKTFDPLIRIVLEVNWRFLTIVLLLWPWAKICNHWLLSSNPNEKQGGYQTMWKTALNSAVNAVKKSAGNLNAHKINWLLSTKLVCRTCSTAWPFHVLTSLYEDFLSAQGEKSQALLQEISSKFSPCREKRFFKEWLHKMTKNNL